MCLAWCWKGKDSFLDSALGWNTGTAGKPARQTSAPTGMSTLASTPLHRTSGISAVAREFRDLRSPAATATHRRLALLARIRRRYQTVEQELTIGGLRLSFTRVADPDRVLDEIADEADR